MSLKIQSLFSKTLDKIYSYRCAQKEKRIASYFTIHNLYSKNNEISQQLFLMREPIANMAKSHNIKVDIFDMSKDTGAQSDKLAVVVSTNKGKTSLLEVFDKDVSKKYPKEKSVPVMLDVRGEDQQIERISVWATEDSLATHIYRTIETMYKNLNK